jgi:hypothetical protein
MTAVMASLNFSGTSFIGNWIFENGTLTKEKKSPYFPSKVFPHFIRT